MNGYVPFGLIAIFISLYYFYETNRVGRIKKENRQIHRRNKHEELIDTAFHSKKPVKKNTGDNNEVFKDN